MPPGNSAQRALSTKTGYLRWAHGTTFCPASQQWTSMASCTFPRAKVQWDPVALWGREMLGFMGPLPSGPRSTLAAHRKSCGCHAAIGKEVMTHGCRPLVHAPRPPRRPADYGLAPHLPADGGLHFDVALAIARRPVRAMAFRLRTPALAREHEGGAQNEIALGEVIVHAPAIGRAGPNDGLDPTVSGPDRGLEFGAAGTTCKACIRGLL
jgi:hypothetical protein